MLCDSKDKEWQNLTFYGLQNCELPEDLESSRHGFLIAAQNQYGEKLIDFSGSIGTCQPHMDSHLKDNIYFT
jgi:hypothetical protein